MVQTPLSHTRAARRKTNRPQNYATLEKHVSYPANPPRTTSALKDTTYVDCDSTESNAETSGDDDPTSSAHEYQSSSQSIETDVPMSDAISEQRPTPPAHESFPPLLFLSHIAAGSEVVAKSINTRVPPSRFWVLYFSFSSHTYQWHPLDLLSPILSTSNFRDTRRMSPLMS
jgi:hypothetical protein